MACSCISLKAGDLDARIMAGDLEARRRLRALVTTACPWVRTGTLIGATMGCDTSRFRRVFKMEPERRCRDAERRRIGPERRRIGPERRRIGPERRCRDAERLFFLDLERIKFMFIFFFNYIFLFF